MSARLLAAYPVLGAPDLPRALAFFEALGFVVRFVDDPAAPRYAALAALGVTPSGPYGTPADSPWGTREWHLRDPGGNGVQWYQVRD